VTGDRQLAGERVELLRNWGIGGLNLGDLLETGEGNGQQITN